MLHSPEAHEALAGDAWDPEVARAAIRAIAADCESALDHDGMWPFHPRDGDDGPFTTMYIGAAGVVFALDALTRRGLVELTRDYVPILERHVETYRAAPEFDEWGAHPPSLWMGETGILATLQRIRPTGGTRARIAELVEANAHDTHHEFMWGSPGTMLAARWIGRDDLWELSANWLRGEWNEESGLWTQDLYGDKRSFLGPAHGFAGCVAALAAHTDAELHRRASDTFKRFAIEEKGRANWPPLAGAGLGGSRDGLIRLQWCHGAPGMVASLAQIAPGDDEHERLLLAGGELVWGAGPLEKGANLCHGTAGNGLAFLKLFERTGDERWLDRARAFAMHSIGQVAQERREVGHGRYSLWTGDPGTALYVALCLDGETALPGFDA